jgi:hypothetical protein
MAKQAVLTAQQLLQAVADMFAKGAAHASELRSGVEPSREFAQQLFLFVVSQLKLLRGFYRMHGSSSSLGLMLKGWRALGWVRAALQCILTAAGPTELRTDDSGSSSSKVGAAAELWPFVTALALRDASEVLQLLLQGHGLPPTHRADLLAETLESCCDAVLRLSAAPVALDAATPQQSDKGAALVEALREAADAAAAAVPGLSKAPAVPAADGSLPLKSFSAEELRQLLSAQVVQLLAEFSTAAAAALPLLGSVPTVSELGGLLCNSPSCTNMQGVNEQQLVVAGTKRCSACHCAVYCCKACQVAHWKMGHRQACKRLTAAAAAAASGGK